MNVYIAFDGEYSSRGVIAVFSSKEKADECSGDVEEFDLDEMADRTMHTVYDVRISAEDGSLLKSSKRTIFEVPNYCQSKMESEWRVRSAHSPGYAVYPRALGTSSVSEDHALKLAAEARQLHLRECALLPKPGIDRVRNAASQGAGNEV